MMKSLALSLVVLRVPVLVAAIVSLFLSLGIFLVFPEYPFIHRMGVVFIVSGFSCYMTALLQGYQNQEKAGRYSAQG